MAIAHVATEYVFSDFLLKDPSQVRYRNIRTELAADKMVTCVAFFPYILLLVSVLMYTPALFWRFTTAPLLQSDLGFIMEELDRCYNRAVTLAKRMANNDLPFAADSDPTEGCFMYPLVENYLVTKRCSRGVLVRYLLCRGATLLILLCTCVYLGYYLRLASLTDQFGCSLRTGLLVDDPSVPEKVQCKLIAVGVFSLLCLVNLVLFSALVPVVIYAGLRPILCLGYASFLDTYQSLPTVSVLPRPGSQWDDLTLYLLFLEENLSELKSYKYIKVLELLKRRGECAGENFDSMGLLQTLCLVKTDSVDGRKGTRRPADGKRADLGPAGPNGSPGLPGPATTPVTPTVTTKPSRDGPRTDQQTEMKEFTPLLSADSDVIGGSQ
ncbi:hypothetical protein CRUP_009326 [Coryphaenoides rupestris]|nr:hypothetical protein CRUP_009326 [Coryphaenoides rupestris]